MKLISVQVALRPTGRLSAIAAAPFLGGVLHGVLEDKIRTHAPQIVSALNIQKDTPFKRYAVLPPPFGLKSDLTQSPIHLGFGVILFSDAVPHADAVSGALKRWQELHFGGYTDVVEFVKTEYTVPKFAIPLSATNSLTLEWLTPLMLDTPGQRAAGVVGKAPSLLRVVRSLVKRVEVLEPDLAESLGLGKPEWVEAEESIRSALVVRQALRSVHWPYGSRNHQAPMKLNGLLGEVSYRGRIAPAIHTLLHWGCWFGVGQRTALGQGLYQIKETMQ